MLTLMIMMSEILTLTRRFQHKHMQQIERGLRRAVLPHLVVGHSDVIQTQPSVISTTWKMQTAIPLSALDAQRCGAVLVSRAYMPMSHIDSICNATLTSTMM